MVIENSYLWTQDHFYYFLTRVGYSVGGYLLVVLIPAVVTLTSIAISFKLIINLDKAENPMDINRGLSTGFYYLSSLLLLLSSSDFLMQIINQTRQLMAFGFIVFGVYFLYKKKYFLSVVFLLLSINSHHSIPIIILPMVLSCIIKDTRLWLFSLIISLLLSLSGISTMILDYTGMGVDSDSIYFNAINSNIVLYIKTGITCILGVVCFIVTRKFVKTNNCKSYSFYSYLLNIYIGICDLAILFIMYGEASNRIQRYAGVLFPLLFALSMRKIRLNELTIVMIMLGSILYMIFMMNYQASLITIGIFNKAAHPL